MLRPTVMVTVSISDLSIRTKALIDTGAPRCVFPRGVGDLIGLNFPKYASQATSRVKLMGEEWPAITAAIQLVLEPFDDLGWEAEADFVLDDGLAFALLGFEGFLNRWAVSFNGGFGYFVVQPADEFHDDQPPETLSQLRTEWPHLFP